MGDEDIVDEARAEWRMDGVLSTSTYIKLSNAGYNADAIIEQFSEESEDEADYNDFDCL
jgi:hypothetical protein